MCLIAFAINAWPRWPLVIASNRDEFVERPTLPLAPWTSASGHAIVSGRDLRAGGTWLGLTPGGRLAFVTNVREAQPLVAPRSRGELVTRWLEDDGDAADFIAALQADPGAYAGFNLVLGDFQRNDWTWVTNRSAAAPHWQARTLSPGVYGLSNAQLDTPWPKTLELKRVLSAALQDGHGEPSAGQLQEPLWAALAKQERAAAGQLPETGVEPAFESALSSAFVDFPEHGYGTRSSTLVLASALPSQGEGRRWGVLVEEKTYRRVGTRACEAAPTERCQLSWQQAQAG